MIKLTTELINSSKNHIDLEKFRYLNTANKCPLCKNKIKGYLQLVEINGSKINRVNWDTLVHLWHTHGIPHFVVLDWIKTMYKTKEAQIAFEENYKWLYDK